MKRINSSSPSTQATPSHKPGLVALVPYLAFCLLLSGCGSGGDSSEPDPIVEATSTDVLKRNAASNIGGSLDSALDGTSRVTSGSSDSSFDDPAESGVGGLWSNDAQNLINASLELESEDNTVREGSVITIDPDDAAVCSEEFIGMSDNQAEFQRCQALMADVLVRINATTDTAGSVTYLFQSQTLVEIAYTDNSNSFELNLGTLKSLIDAEQALNPDSGLESTADTIEGAMRVSASVTNSTSGSEAGSVALEVSQPLKVISLAEGDSLTLGVGKILGVTVDAASDSASIELDVGAMQLSDMEDGSTNTADLRGLTAIIDVTSDADQLVVRNLGVGDGPLRISLDNSEVMNLQLETFGFTVSADDESITLQGGLDLTFLVREIVGDNTVSDTLYELLEMSAPSGTKLIEQINGSQMVSSGGPLTYSLTTTDENGGQTVDAISVSAGQCADDVGAFESDYEIVSCQ